MEFTCLFFLGSVKQILTAVEHNWGNCCFTKVVMSTYGFLAVTLAPNTELVPSSSNVQKGTPSFILCCPNNCHSSPVSFCSRSCSKFTRDSEPKHQEFEARFEYVVCNPVIKDLRNFFFPQLNTWHSRDWYWFWEHLVLYLERLELLVARATCGTDGNQCSQREP